MNSGTNNVSVGRQALRRDVNRRIRSNVDWSSSETIDVFCECGGVRCAERLSIDIRVYDDVLGTPGRYVVATGHEARERPVSRQDGFVEVARAR